MPRDQEMQVLDQEDSLQAPGEEKRLDGDGNFSIMCVLLKS